MMLKGRVREGSTGLGGRRLVQLGGAVKLRGQVQALGQLGPAVKKGTPIKLGPAEKNGITIKLTGQVQALGMQQLIGQVQPRGGALGMHLGTATKKGPLIKLEHMTQICRMMIIQICTLMTVDKGSDQA